MKRETIGFNYQYEYENYSFPLFKFMYKDHAKKMLNKGEVHLPCLSEFRKTSEKSLVYDEKEGTFNFKDTYNYNGKGSEAPYIPNFYFSPNSNVHLENMTVSGDNLNLPDVWVYCTSGRLLSESLTWALKESKTSCVMITNPKKFLELLKSKIKETNFSEFFSCIYVNKKKANKNSDLRQYYFHKPEKYKNQNEVRMVGSSLKAKLEPLTIQMSEIKKILIEIDISNLKLSDVKEGKKKIVHQIIKKDGSIARFLIPTPYEVYSPLIVDLLGCEKSMLGFACPYDGEGYSAGTNISNCEIALCPGQINMSALNPIENVKKITLNME